MNRSNQPFIFFVNRLAGWLNRRQQRVIDYLVEENRILRGQLRGKRLRLTDDQRRRLVVKGRIFGRRLIEENRLPARPWRKPSGVGGVVSHT